MKKLLIFVLALMMLLTSSGFTFFPFGNPLKDPVLTPLAQNGEETVSYQRLRGDLMLAIVGNRMHPERVEIRNMKTGEATALSVRAEDEEYWRDLALTAHVNMLSHQGKKLTPEAIEALGRERFGGPVADIVFDGMMQVYDRGGRYVYLMLQGGSLDGLLDTQTGVLLPDPLEKQTDITRAVLTPWDQYAYHDMHRQELVLMDLDGGNRTSVTLEATGMLNIVPLNDGLLVCNTDLNPARREEVETKRGSKTVITRKMSYNTTITILDRKLRTVASISTQTGMPSIQGCWQSKMNGRILLMNSLSCYLIDPATGNCHVVQVEDNKLTLLPMLDEEGWPQTGSMIPLLGMSERGDCALLLNDTLQRLDMKTLTLTEHMTEEEVDELIKQTPGGVASCIGMWDGGEFLVTNRLILRVHNR